MENQLNFPHSDLFWYAAKMSVSEEIQKLAKKYQSRRAGLWFQAFKHSQRGCFKRQFKVIISLVLQ